MKVSAPLIEQIMLSKCCIQRLNCTSIFFNFIEITLQLCRRHPARLPVSCVGLQNIGLTICDGFTQITFLRAATKYWYKGSIAPMPEIPTIVFCINIGLIHKLSIISQILFVPHNKCTDIKSKLGVVEEGS